MKRSVQIRWQVIIICSLIAFLLGCGIRIIIIQHHTIQSLQEKTVRCNQDMALVLAGQERQKWIEAGWKIANQTTTEKGLIITQWVHE